MRHPGLLIAIEGIDGTGKTTLQRALARRWRALGLRVLTLQEPTRGRSGRTARQASQGDPWSAALAFTADRRQQRPRVDRALAQGRVVLLDRSFYSTLAYQGSALPPGRRRALERLQREASPTPDRVIWLELSVPAAEVRLRARGKSRAPTERRAVLRRASRSYRRFSKKPGWVAVDARKAPRLLVAELDRLLTPWVFRRLRSDRART